MPKKYENKKLNVQNIEWSVVKSYSKCQGDKKVNNEKLSKTSNVQKVNREKYSKCQQKIKCKLGILYIECFEKKCQDSRLKF